MFGGKKPKAHAPRHAMTPAEAATQARHEAMARYELARAEARREDQARFDAEGCPRYVYDVAVG